MIRVLGLTVAAVSLVVPAILAAAIAAPAPPPSKGQALFKENCSVCHKVTGLGVPGSFPALAGNRFLTRDGATIAKVVLNGRGGMPSFRDDLSDAEISTVISYIRSSWGNKAPPVPATVVAGARAGMSGAARGLQAH